MRKHQRRNLVIGFILGFWFADAVQELLHKILVLLGGRLLNPGFLNRHTRKWIKWAANYWVRSAAVRAAPAMRTRLAGEWNVAHDLFLVVLADFGV